MAKGKNQLIEYNEAFLKELKRLNLQQRQAVDQIEGPVLVVAGPGTGKTHILSARIGRILMSTDTQPNNILCLTFTDAGTHAMRERLLQFIGPEAHKVHIYTFHSFCNKVIQENLELFGIQQLEPLSELERVEIIRKLIDELPLAHPLKRGRRDIYFYEKHLHHLFQMMKKEHWTATYLQERIRLYLEGLPSRPEFIYKVKSGRYKKGDIKEGKLQLVKEKMERLWEAAVLFERYTTLLRQHRRYDYEDMILWVIKEFGRYEKLLRYYQEQYLYLMVDEFQDTSGAQNAILQLLIQYWENPNIFIVGDDDQSIYEFQGARLKNILDFHEQYKNHIELVFLKNNYRSSQAILDTSKVLIDQNKKRIASELNIDKTILASNPDQRKTKVVPVIRVYPNRIQEETDILLTIKKLQEDGMPLNEMAIIYARHKQARTLIDLFEKQKIPYQTKRRVNILDLPMIQNLRLLLEYIHLEYNNIYKGEHLLFQILNLNFLETKPADIIKVSRYIAQQKEAVLWRDVIADETVLSSLNLENAEPFQRFSQLSTSIIYEYRNLPLISILERLINRSGLLRYLLTQAEKSWYLQVLNTFLNFVKIEIDRKPRMKLRGLLEVLQKMDANRIAIAIEKIVEVEEGVHLVTAHSAKGLEYDCVFVIDGVKDYWEPGKKSPFQFALPDTLTFSGEEDALEARRRLFYVAMTRAKEYLYISYSQTNNVNKPLQQTQFIDEIIAGYDIEVEEREVDATYLVDSLETLLLETEAPAIAPLEKALVTDLLKDFKLSVSTFNRYLQCPLTFYYESVLKIPSINSEAAAYGTAMHYALMILFEKMRRSETKEFPALKHVLGYFNTEMKRQIGYFTDSEYERRLALGRANLSTIYTEHLPHWHKETKAELSIRNTTIEGVPVVGTVDKIEYFKNHKAHIVDYKTGSHTGSKLSKPTKQNPHGGHYWRQLVFYKLLVESQQLEQTIVQSGEIFYMDPGPNGKLASKKINITSKDAALVKDLVTEVYQKIQAQDFYTGCGKPRCTWCNFVKRNQLVDSLVNVEIDELDDT